MALALQWSIGMRFSLQIAGVLAGWVSGACAGGSSEHAGPDGGAGDFEQQQPADAGAVDSSCSVDLGMDQRAYFTEPSGQPDYTIEDALVSLIDGATAEARIRVAVAYLDQPRIATALGSASARGVDVRVILDERNQVRDSGGAWQWNAAVELLGTELGDQLIVCGGGDQPADGGGCIGATKHHNSMLLVSHLCDGSTDVVAQGSGFYTHGQLFEHNNLVVLGGDPDLFSAMESYWQDLAGGEQQNDYYWVADGANGTRAFFFPRAAEGGNSATDDTVYNILGKADCAAKTRVRIAMAYWTTGRGYLVDRLGAMSGAGCEVQVAFDKDRVQPEVIQALGQALPAANLFGRAHVHHKYILIDGQYAGEKSSSVWVGTQDFTKAALRDNDEVLLKVADSPVFSAFSQNWAVLTGQ